MAETTKQEDNRKLTRAQMFCGRVYWLVMRFMSKYDTQIDDCNSICPYCEDSFQVEGEDYSEDSQKIECDNCGKNYWLRQNFTIDHHTRPDCEINGEEHQYLSNGKQAYFCTVCDDCKISLPA